MLPVVLAAVVALAVGAAAPELWAQDGGPPEQIPFDDARIIIELNSTDEDAGIQVFLDGEGWRKVQVVSPDGRRIFEVQDKGDLRELGLTELFFESEEPSLDEVPLAEFLDLFPEGEYQFFGKTVEGDRLAATATLTHDIPDGPVLVSPAEGEVVDPDDTFIVWDLVTSPPGIDIVGYQVIVEREDPLRVFSVDLSASATSVMVPPEFLESETEYKFEVLAIEVSGNQTISESFFETE
jgi:hypothetical protein